MASGLYKHLLVIARLNVTNAHTCTDSFQWKPFLSLQLCQDAIFTQHKYTSNDVKLLN